MATNFLMIDDDEIASPDWLERMMSDGRDRPAPISSADRSLPNFDDERKARLAPPSGFAPAYDASGPVPVIYGCGNCLIRRSVFDRVGARRHSIFASIFWVAAIPISSIAACRLGLHFHWVAEAMISETVPQSRTSLSWLVTRGLRIGAINYHVQRKATPTAWLRAKLTAQIAGGPAAFACLCRARRPDRA